MSEDSGTIVRLNLGCGGHKLQGYVNVDIAAERAGERPDIECDIRQLTPCRPRS